MSEFQPTESRRFCDDFVSFLNEAASNFHAVEASKSILIAKGFEELKETENWPMKPCGKYFFIRNGTTIIAFTVGGAYEIGNGFTVLGAHTDSPCLKIKPVPCITKSDCLMLNTQPYGGGLWHTWFDRDLGLAGRVLYRTAEGSISSSLCRIDKPIARIPNLAIHLSADRNKFEPNLQEHAQALLIASVPKGLKSPESSVLHPVLCRLVAEATGVSVESIVDLELQLIDTQPSVIGGAEDDLLFSGRLDNLCSSYQCLRALVDGANDSIETQKNIRVVALFDHEEVGSASTQGAGSSLFLDTLRRISDSISENAISNSQFLISLRRSLVVSADMAHGLHPNYSSKHDSSMAPRLNGGMVIKHNCNQRYATNAVSATMFREFARIAGIKVQEFAIRSDGACGSTIGPIIATLSGILTVDVGTPQLSMHSIREMMGSHDAYTGYAHLSAALKHHPELAQSMRDI